MRAMVFRRGLLKLRNLEPRVTACSVGGVAAGVHEPASGEAHRRRFDRFRRGHGFYPSKSAGGGTVTAIAVLEVA